ncbi:LOW QUALITY PROTEIN: hypothetical protein NC653_005987 [Populus alba x Populus x berolinensis]|uniref:Uncharacterized protein n=1 Tax=Populus alba x Populus x berolinensis TaxID=444605 RepID=A0AAD6RDA0_9ROSI|nr:LOW QUALITY PROTEIN: hypothetical protein NC653_005987 [Populus alba x Populus x berolinensis]
MERADGSLLPGVYKRSRFYLAQGPDWTWVLDPSSSCYPIAAYLAVRHHRARVGVPAFLKPVAISGALKGIGLDIVAPATQSLVADSTDDSNRGTAFGWLQLTPNFGSITGGFCSVLIAPATFMVIPGWRVAFDIAGIISMLIGELAFKIQVNPNEHRCRTCSMKPNYVSQGVTDLFPWSAMASTPVLLELTGFSHEKTLSSWRCLSLLVSLGAWLEEKWGISFLHVTQILGLGG